MVEITLETVKLHNKPSDLWVVIENKVYDLTKFRGEHPGGEETLDEVAGRDATKDFIDVGHSQEAREIMKKYYVGDLAAKDCKGKLPLREIGICLASVVIGAVAVLLVKKVLAKN
ncbi:cytochrome b5 isoform X1 [Musca domestica]|uniref:Cytochrome b5 n=2 Tax=Musca domestica TaxID=7370 RepID=A0A1I8N799_MUSDO|nr:cytochrome b5 isoform X1 [Musca domestica]